MDFAKISAQQDLLGFTQGTAHPHKNHTVELSGNDREVHMNMVISPSLSLKTFSMANLAKDATRSSSLLLGVNLIY